MSAPATSSVDDAALRRALAVQLVKTGGSGTTEDAAAVVGELAKMPLAELQRMQRNGTKVVACRGSVTDYLSEYRGQAPRGWPAGSTWDTVPGFFEPGRNEVVVATQATSPTDATRRVPPTGVGHGSVNMVVHESGHSLDYRSGKPSATDPAFLAAYQADLPQLPAYLAQAGDAGREEAFAESLAASVAGGPLAARAPHLLAYWATHDPFQPAPRP